MIEINLRIIGFLAALFMALSSARAELATTEGDPFCEKAGEVNPPNSRCVTSSSFVDKVLKSDDLVIVMATATWCPPCRRIKVELEEILAPFKDKKLQFYGINYDQNADFLKSIFQIESIPSIHVFYKGERRWKFSGAPGKLAFIRDLQYALDSVENGRLTIEKYPTLLVDTSKDPVADKILKYRKPTP